MKRAVVWTIQVFFRATRLGMVTKTTEESDGYFHPETRRHIDLVRFVTDSGISKDVKVLDVGCGDGTLALRLRRAGFCNLTGVDWIPPAQIKPNSVNSYRQANLNDDGLGAFADASFGCVVCSDVIEHLENPPFLLRELARVTKKDGHIFVTIPNAFNIFERVALLLTGNSNRYKTERPESFGHISMFPSNVMRSLCARAGLQLVETGTGYCLFAGTMIFPNRNFGNLLSYVSYLHFCPSSTGENKEPL